MLNRRMVLLGSTALGGCATFNANAGKVATDVGLIADGLKGVLTQLGSLNIPQLTPSVMSTVGSAVASLEALAQQIAAASSTAAQQPLVQQIYTYVSRIVAVLTPILAAIPATAGIAVALQAAQVLLPIIFAAVNLVLPASAPAVPGSIPLTPDEARLILRGKAQMAK